MNRDLRIHMVEMELYDHWRDGEKITKAACQIVDVLFPPTTQTHTYVVDLIPDALDYSNLPELLAEGHNDQDCD